MKEFAQKYFDLLTKDYAGINLTRITEFEEFYNKQIIDSIIPYQKSSYFKKCLDENRLLVDVGFGGGFPIIPLAKLLPEYQFVGIETRGKKVKVVSELIEKLNIKNVTLIHDRLENIEFDVSCVSTLKAVGRVDTFLEKYNCNSEIDVFFYKGPSFQELESESLVKIKKDWLNTDLTMLEVPGTEQRIIIGFKNINVPCGTFSNKKLVKLSSII